MVAVFTLVLLFLSVAAYWYGYASPLLILCVLLLAYSFRSPPASTNITHNIDLLDPKSRKMFMGRQWTTSIGYDNLMHLTADQLEFMSGLMGLANMLANHEITARGAADALCARPAALRTVTQFLCCTPYIGPGNSPDGFDEALHSDSYTPYQISASYISVISGALHVFQELCACSDHAVLAEMRGSPYFDGTIRRVVSFIAMHHIPPMSRIAINCLHSFCHHSPSSRALIGDTLAAHNASLVVLRRRAAGTGAASCDSDAEYLLGIASANY